MTLEETLRASFKTDAMQRLGYLLRYGAVPFRGAAGRASPKTTAARRSTAEAGPKCARRVRELHAAGLSNSAIAQALGAAGRPCSAR